MPPAVSIPLALLFFGLFYLVLCVALGGYHWIAPTFAGVLAGYLAMLAAERNRSAYTLRNYGADLRPYFAFLHYLIIFTNEFSFFRFLG